MKLLHVYFFITVSRAFVNIQQNLDTPENIHLYKSMRTWISQFFDVDRTIKYYKEAEDAGRIQARIPDKVPFPCNLTGGRSSDVPSSVHKLRPGDIDVIGAMGDSLTAGVGIFSTQPFHLLLENRGASATGGGQGSWREYLTLPNILKEFNPNLIGYSSSDSFEFQTSSKFNVAEIGAFSRNLPSMTRTLIEKMKNDLKVDIKKHWKLISILIGPNDFCSDMCYLPSPWTILKNHKRDLITSLRIIRDNLPRTFVNLILPPNLKIVIFEEMPSICYIISMVECSCIFSRRWLKERPEFFEIMTRFQKIEEEVAQYPEFQTNNFAVVTQPFAVNLTFPTNKDGSIDFSFLSSDCFHHSQKSNARAANALWNNMMEPVQQKSQNWETTFKKFACPTAERPYIATWKNSYE